MHSRTRRRALAATASVALLGGFGVGPAAAATPAWRPAVPPPAPVLSVSSSRGHLTVDGSVQRRPGLLTVSVAPSSDGATVSLVRLHSGYTPAQYRADVVRSYDSAAAELRTSRLADHVGGVDVQPDQAQTFTSLLLSGTYYLVDAGGDAPELHPVEVAGPPQLSRPPRPDGAAVLRRTSITAPDVLPHDGHLTLVNGDTGTHLLCLDGVRRGTTLADVRAYLRDPEGPPSFADGPAGCTATASPGVTFTVSYARPAGSYVMFDPRPDPQADDTPYGAEGAVHLVTLR
jgi:hypothetical protein